MNIRFSMPLLTLALLSTIAAGADVTRRDLANAYLSFEQALRQASLSSERRAEINRRFDGLTSDFFTARLADALRELNELTLSLDPAAAASDRAARSLQVRVVPPVWTNTPGSAPPRIVLESLYRLPVAQTHELVVSIDPTGGHDATIDVPVTLEFGPDRDIDRAIPLSPDSFEGALVSCMVYIAPPGAKRILTGQWIIAPESAAELASRETRRLSTLPPGHGLAREASIARARLLTITDDPSEDKAVHFLIDPLGTLAEVHHEIAILCSEGRNPYRRRVGSYWRTLDLGEGRIMPLWVHAPRSGLERGPMPLVIALHGAGGDESLFMRGYGGGRIVELSDQEGFLLISPSTLLFGSDPGVFDRLLTDLAIDYTIDRSRMYIVGHSLGAIAAAGLASARGSELAAVVCIAGMRSIPEKPRPCPVLVVAGGLDPIFPPERLESAVRGSGASESIELQVMPGEGHTLIVGEALPGIVEWLRSKSLD